MLKSNSEKWVHQVDASLTWTQVDPDLFIYEENKGWFLPSNSQIIYCCKNMLIYTRIYWTNSEPRPSLGVNDFLIHRYERNGKVYWSYFHNNGVNWPNEILIEGNKWESEKVLPIINESLADRWRLNELWHLRHVVFHIP